MALKADLAEDLLFYLSELFEETLNIRINNWNIDHLQRWVSTIVYVKRGMFQLRGEQLPLLSYHLNWGHDAPSFQLDLNLIFEDDKHPCRGFRYGEILEELIIDSEELKMYCDTITLEKHNYTMSPQEGSPSQLEMRFILHCENM